MTTELDLHFRVYLVTSTAGRACHVNKVQQQYCMWFTIGFSFLVLVMNDCRSVLLEVQGINNHKAGLAIPGCVIRCACRQNYETLGSSSYICVVHYRVWFSCSSHESHLEVQAINNHKVSGFSDQHSWQSMSCQQMTGSPSYHQPQSWTWISGEIYKFFMRFMNDCRSGSPSD